MTSISLPSLVRRHLRQEAFFFDDLNPARRDEAIAACAAGCDHLAGEQLLAVIDDVPLRDVFLGVLITDRRIVWRNLRSRGQVRFRDIETVKVRHGVMVHTLTLGLRGGNIVQVPAPTTGLAELVQDAAELPVDERAPTSSPGAIDEQTLLERMVSAGRGQQGGWWLSPLSPTPLIAAFAGILGAPTTRGGDDDRAVADFALGDRWSQKGRLTVEDDVQRRTLEDAGFGQRVRKLRVMARCQGPGSGFWVKRAEAGRDTVLSLCNPGLLAALSKALLMREHDQIRRAPGAQRYAVVGG